MPNETTAERVYAAIQRNVASYLDRGVSSETFGKRQRRLWDYATRHRLSADVCTLWLESHPVQEPKGL